MLEQRRVEGRLEVARCRAYWGCVVVLSYLCGGLDLEVSDGVETPYISPSRNRQFQGKFVLTKAEPPLFYIPSK